MESQSGHGGTRRGAGRKPGGAVVRVAATELAKIGEEYEDNLDFLLAKNKESGLDTEERKQAYVGLILRGMGNNTACKELGVHENLGWYYRKQPWFQDKIKEGLSTLQNSRWAVFGPMLPQAMKVYEKHLEENDAKVAENVFDEAFGKPIAHEAPTIPHSITLVFVSRSKPEIAIGGGEVIEGEVREVEAPREETTLP